MKKTVNDWIPAIQVVLKSKVEEFILMGYSQATTADVLKCLQNHIWKGNPKKHLHEVVQDIYKLDASTYMNYLTVNVYQEDDLLSSIAALTEDT